MRGFKVLCSNCKQTLFLEAVEKDEAIIEMISKHGWISDKYSHYCSIECLNDP